MKICICGGGSLGHVCAGVFSSIKGVSVNVYTQHPELWSKEISVTDLQNKRYVGNIAVVSNSPQETVSNSDIVFLCLPGFLIEKTLLAIKPYIVPSTIVGSIVSSTGFFFQAHKILLANTKLFGFQRTPFIARISEYGKSASLLGYKPEICVAVENVADKEAFRKGIEKLFITPTILLNNYYEACLTNSNPILHTGRLYGLWHTWHGEILPACPFFYKDWNVESSSIIIEMDNEFMQLLDTLHVDKIRIPTLLDYYESTDAFSLAQKLSSIPAFQSILSPMKKKDFGWVPDFASRYFTEDFPYGLRFIKELAKERNIETPMIDRVYCWGMNMLGHSYL